MRQRKYVQVGDQVAEVALDDSVRKAQWQGFASGCYRRHISMRFCFNAEVFRKQTTLAVSMYKTVYTSGTRHLFSWR